MLDQLFPYQRAGAEWLAGKDQALLADEMGLGKSAQAIIACDSINADDILIICPASARVNWSREFDRFSIMSRDCTILFTAKDRPASGVNIVSYDLIASNEKLRAELKKRKWSVLIMDEAHYCKERTAKRTKSIYGHAQHTGIAHSAERVWRLTGTPAPNNASELYTHLKSMGAINSSYWDFVFEFCEGFNSDYGFKVTGVRNVEKLRAIMAPYMLRRKKSQVMTQLPPIVFSTVTVQRSKVELDPYFFEDYQPIGVPEFLKRLENMNNLLKTGLDTIRAKSRDRSDDMMGFLNSQRQATSTLRRYIGLAKLPACLDIIEEELASGAIKKIVLFAVHQQVIEETRLRLRKFKPVTLYGGTPVEKRQLHIDAFQNTKECRVFIGQIIAAGSAITLTAANEIAFLEQDWVPGNNAQASMRCHRIGQTKKVRVRFFVCADSIDEDVMEAVAIKTRTLTNILD